LSLAVSQSSPSWHEVGSPTTAFCSNGGWGSTFPLQRPRRTARWSICLILPHGRPHASQSMAFPSVAPSRAYQVADAHHSCDGEGGGDQRRAHKEQGPEGGQRDLDPAALELDPHPTEKQDTGREHGQQDVIV